MLILFPPPPPPLRFEDPALLFLYTNSDKPALPVLERALELFFPFFATPPLLRLPLVPPALALELPPPRC